MKENKKPENPSAFPIVLPADEKKGWSAEVVEGMTLRDYFANSVIQSYVKEHLELLRENKYGYSVNDMADSAYVFADAMLKARNNQTN